MLQTGENDGKLLVCKCLIAINSALVVGYFIQQQHVHHYYSPPELIMTLVIDIELFNHSEKKTKIISIQKSH